MPAPALSRRRFLKNLAFGARKTSAETGTHTLVHVFLRGGADWLNLLVPYGDDEYYRQRPTLGIARPGGGDGAALKLTDFHGLHSEMAPLLPLYREGRLGFVQGVGTDNPTGSHFEAQDQMEHGASYGLSPGGGWLGRHLRSTAGDSPTPLSAVAIGPTLPESLRGAPAASAIRALADLQIRMPKGGDADAVTRALAQMYGHQSDLLGQQGRDTLALLQRVRDLRAADYVPDAGVTYDDDDFGRGLREIARLVKADVGLEVACIDLDGWDTHFVQGSITGLLSGLVKRLSRGLAAFEADTRSVRARVTVLVMTEFGRRVYENNSFGTDHGRGFTAMALGAGVNGGRVHGAYPGLEEDAQQEGPDGVRVEVDYRSVLAEALTTQMGNRDIDAVFPGFAPAKVGLFG